MEEGKNMDSIYLAVRQTRIYSFACSFANRIHTHTFTRDTQIHSYSLIYLHMSTVNTTFVNRFGYCSCCGNSYSCCFRCCWCCQFIVVVWLYVVCTCLGRNCLIHCIIRDTQIRANTVWSAS